MAKRLDAGVSGSSSILSSYSQAHLPLSSWGREVIQLFATTHLRPVQAKALTELGILTSRRNLIVSAPTNSGKSLVGLLILLDAIRNGRRAVLLEPLRAVAQEKAQELTTLLPALTAALSCDFSITVSTGDYRLEHEALSAPPPNKGELVIATPERMEAIWRNPAYQSWIASIGAICVDEGHLISDSHRGPTLEYLITSFLCLPAPPRLVLLSATLGDTHQAQTWLHPCDVVCINDRYPPLAKEVLALASDEDANQVVVDLAHQILADPAASLLIFVYQTRSAERLANQLSQAFSDRKDNAQPLPYHAQLSTQERQRVHHLFRSGESRCLVTTTALGLGVNLPATHVIIRDTTFPGHGRLETNELLQMIGRAGRGDRVGHATVLARPGDQWQPEELAHALRQEKINSLTSAFEPRQPRHWQSATSESSNIQSVATLLASHLARQSDAGLSPDEIVRFFQRSLGGQAITSLVPAGLQWLTDPIHTLAYLDEHNRYHLTVLGEKATRATLPLGVASGFSRLIRDLLTIDPSDQLLASWQPLDYLIVLNLLRNRTSNLRSFSAALVAQVDDWMEQSPTHSSLLYRQWLRGEQAFSRADEVLGSLGIAAPPNTQDTTEWARRTSYSTLLTSILLYERGQGKRAEDLARQWRLRLFEGIEERLRDDTLWLLSGLANVLDLRCFFYHLKQECAADPERIRRVKQIFRQMTRQTYDLQEQLKYCSPLGPILLSIRRSQAHHNGATIGIGTIRRLEEAGITTIVHLTQMTVEDLVQHGVRRDFARQIRRYIQLRSW